MAMKRYDSVEHFFKEQTLWKSELLRLREIMLSTGMDECLKWSLPNYSHRGKNVAGISGFKSYFGIWFHQGALLNDPQDLLVSGQQGTRAMRQWRMSSKADIKVRTIKMYLKEAMALVEEGREVKPRRKSNKIDVPQLLADMLKQRPGAAKQFEKLTPAKQREYCEYVGSAKREETKLRRLEKIRPLIEAGHGLNDLYRNRE